MVCYLKGPEFQEKSTEVHSAKQGVSGIQWPFYLALGLGPQGGPEWAASESCCTISKYRYNNVQTCREFIQVYLIRTDIMLGNKISNAPEFHRYTIKYLLAVTYHKACILLLSSKAVFKNVWSVHSLKLEE